ncbi:hypothetical protein [Actinacidiphila glaucinigra]|uniref:hypothetical protein n=1 Tax=Actinacidiphila glaucinigra TaxID=235986 RepID=UPI0037186666
MKGLRESQRLALFVGQVTSGLSTLELARRFGRAKKTTWANYRNGSRDIPHDLLKELIRELCPTREHERLFGRAALLVRQAKNAQQGRGLAVEPESAEVGRTAVKALGNVIWATEKSVFVRDVNNDLRTGELRLGELSYTESIPSDMAKRYPVGRAIPGHFVTDEDGTRFTRRHGQTNPWPRWSELYRVGSTVIATVTLKQGTGAFVELESGGVSRLSNTHDLDIGSQLDVKITSFYAARQLIRVARATTPREAAQMFLPLSAYPQVEDRLWSTVIAPDAGKGVYLLVELNGYAHLKRAAILHSSQMTEELKARTAAGTVAQGEQVYVEVLKVHASQQPGVRDVTLREVPQTPGDVWL